MVTYKSSTLHIIILLYTLLFVIGGCTSSNSEKASPKNSNDSTVIDNQLPSQSSIGTDSTKAHRPTRPKHDTNVVILQSLPDSDGYYYINMNDEYCNTMSNAERAAVGFIGTFIGNDCDYDDITNEFNCSIIKTLGLGAYGYDKHLSFLRSWFRNDTNSLAQLEDPHVAPFTATVQDSFEKMTLISRGDTIIIDFVGTFMNLRENYFAKWNETDYFLITKNSITFIKQHKDELTEK